MKKLSTSQKMLIGMILGLVVGLIVGKPMAVVKPLGTIFVNLLKMSMVPIVFVSITLSIASLDDIRKFGRIAIRTFIWYCITTVIAACISLCYASLIKPGVGFIAEGGEATQKAADISVVDTLMSIVPTNIIQAMANAHLLSIIFFSIMFGVALCVIGDKKKPVLDFMTSLQDAIIAMVKIILMYGPIGVFCLMAAMAGTYGSQVFSTLGKFLITDYAGFLTQFVVVYGIMMAMCGIPWPTFINHAKDAIITAATTVSSAATVPVEIDICEEKLGVPAEVGGFSYPFGATVNQNGTAINICCCVLFSAQVSGFTFTPAQLATLVFTALVSSIGCAGIPGGGTVFTLAILAQYGIPTEAFAMIIACYTLVDIGSTTMNITGDMATSILVSHQEGLLNREVWKKGYVPKAKD